jgi:hypothetical protein
MRHPRWWYPYKDYSSSELLASRLLAARGRAKVVPVDQGRRRTRLVAFVHSEDWEVLTKLVVPVLVALIALAIALIAL